ncbi:DUF433 domain-containing protein [cf. Phormidesmis sp. LEGE 11477]|uniref:DUF433 domain-containing protein n=1 Tax=cf. Phormidesmis sp. LEGE 11477 TaxID=1828680 RepID=UPI001882511A|nr:DUF433 domain-containing protein [cf. Phormidesmis sp. LEGE 11477]MBE9060028.1 DUF433 domain-containing protein [cf. Phormidesmis sp. LEGE 11477]
MTYLATDYKHIQLDDGKVPVIEGSTMKVVELIASHFAYGWSPEELHFQYPHIALGKIYSALAYYWDHQVALDEDMKQRLEKVKTLQHQSPHSRIVQGLRERGVIS